MWDSRTDFHCFDVEFSHAFFTGKTKGVLTAPLFYVSSRQFWSKTFFSHILKVP